MSAEIELEYPQLPGVALSYLRAATTLSGDLAPGRTIPAISAHLFGLDVRAENLARYRKVCDFAHSSALPVTYPHVLGFPLQMAVMTHRAFPLRLLGLIHIRNEIIQRRPIVVDERLDITVSVKGHRDVPLGVEFDLVTRLRDAAGESVWEETGTMLSRRSTPQAGERKQKQMPQGLGFDPQHETLWSVPSDTGRRYARVAGDYNPIHLSPWTARLFGFPRAIATGMWTMARVAAALEPELSAQTYILSVDFRKPLFLPSIARFVYRLGATGAEFALTSERENTVHLQGEVRYL